MNENPYSQPDSEVQPVSDPAAMSVGAARARPISHGWHWYRQAWELFKPSWGIWLLTLLLLVVIMVVLQLIPLLGAIAANLIAPVLVAGILRMAVNADAGKGVEIGELFAGFSERTGPLVGLGALNMLVTFLVVGAMIAPMLAAMDMSAMQDMGSMQGMSDEEIARRMTGGGGPGAGSVLLMLLGAALLIPWLAAYWFAVPLIFLGDRGLGAALKESFFAVFRNILPFLWFGVLYFILAAIATIPLMLGWLVLLPVLMLTIYASFRDIFMEGNG